jgi:hypothetical protein
MAGLGRALIGIGLGLAALGALLWAGARVGLGRLPGDLSFRRGSFAFYFPLASSLLLSLILTVLLNVIFRFRR